MPKQTCINLIKKKGINIYYHKKWIGFDPNCLFVDLPELAYRMAFDEVEEAVFYRHIVPEIIWKIQKWLDIGEEKKLSRAMEIIDRFLYQCISLKQEEFRTQRPQIEQVDQTKDEDFDLLKACMAQKEEAEMEMEGNEKMDAYIESDRYLRDIAFNS